MEPGLITERPEQSSSSPEKAQKASSCSARDLGSIPGLGRSPGEGHGNPLQYSCLENSMDEGGWWALYSPWGHKELDTTDERLVSSILFLVMPLGVREMLTSSDELGSIPSDSIL